MVQLPPGPSVRPLAVSVLLPVVEVTGPPQVFEMPGVATVTMPGG